MAYTTATRKKKIYRRKKAAPKKKSNLVKLIKNVVLKNSETKNVPYSHGKIELYHNSGSPASGRILHSSIQLDGAAMNPSQGTDDDNRIGNSINVRGVKVRMLLGQKDDRMNVTFRIVVIKVTPQQEPSAVNQMFDDVSGNIMLDSLNTDRFKVVYSKFIKSHISPQLGTGASSEQKEFTRIWRFYLRTPRKIDFRDPSSNEYSGFRHYMYVFAYDAYGTLITDNIGYVQTYTNLYFKDP